MFWALVCSSWRRNKGMSVTKRTNCLMKPKLTPLMPKALQNIAPGVQFVIQAAQKRRQLAVQNAIQLQSLMGITTRRHLSLVK